jgi:hypothetical protein
VRTGEKWDALRDIQRKRRAVALERIEKTHTRSLASGQYHGSSFDERKSAMKQSTPTRTRRVALPALAGWGGEEA